MRTWCDDENIALGVTCQNGPENRHDMVTYSARVTCHFTPRVKSKSNCQLGDVYSVTRT